MKVYMAKKKIVGTVLFYMAFTFLVITFAIPALILACLPARWRYTNRFYGWGSFFCYWLLLKATRMQVTIRGKENIPHESAIFVANHQSLLDIPLLGQLAHGVPQVWLLKEDLQKVPVFGFFVSRMGILVDRRTLGTALQALTRTLDVANHQLHVMIFPEGARFVDNHIHAFFSGFAVIAQKTRRPVVPVLIQNVGKVYPPGGHWVYDYPVTVTIGRTMIIGPQEDERAFVQRVHAWFVQQMEQPHDT